jgi:serine protease SohB
MFLAKTVTFVLAVIAILVAIAGSAMKQKQKKGELEITDLSEQFEEVEEDILHALLSKEALKEKEKAQKKINKAQAKKEKSQRKLAKKQGDSVNTDTSDNENTTPLEADKPRAFVLDFNGSMDAKEVSALREEITAILSVAKKNR